MEHLANFARAFLASHPWVRDFIPNAFSLGYALFFAVNATAVWGGVFPFLPLSIQTPSFTVAFFLAHSLIFAFSYLASMMGVYFFPGPTRRFLVWASGIPYCIGWCSLAAAAYLKDHALACSIVGGILIGFGSAGFYMAWQRLFAAEKASEGNKALIVGTLYAPILYFAMYLIPIAVTVFLIPLVLMPLFSLAIVIASRKVDLSQPMIVDIPRSRPGIYRQAVTDYWRSACCVGALALSCGSMRSLAVSTPEIGVAVNMAAMAGTFATALAILTAWRSKPLKISVSSFFRVMFPFVVTAFLALPFLGESYLVLFASVLYAVYSCLITLMMIQCAQASRDRSVNPVFIYAFFAGIVYVMHDAGYIVAMLASGLEPFGFDSLLTISLFCVYALGMVFFVGLGGFKQALSPNRVSAEKVDLIPTAATPATRKRPSATAAPENDRASDGQESAFLDRLSKQCALVSQHYGLSEREAEIMELVARGNTVVRISGMLGISENTVRTHTRRIYGKLDIHKKQELLDLLQSFSPRGLADGKTEKKPRTRNQAL